MREFGKSYSKSDFCMLLGTAHANLAFPTFKVLFRANNAQTNCHFYLERHQHR